jgi:uncharacterized protein (TIGR03382 family)
MRSALLTGVATLAMVCGSASAAVVFADGTFTPSNWGFETLTIGAGGTSVPSQVVIDGNPAPAREIQNTPLPGGTVYGFSRYGTTNATRYEPMTMGEILSVDFRIDYRWTGGYYGSAGHALMVGAKQGSYVYYAAYSVTGTSGVWATKVATGLTASDFLPLVGSAPGLDFSSTGAPIRFGFIVGNSATVSTYFNTVLYDNFEVVVHNVPGPGGAAMMALAGLAAIRRRRFSLA